MVVTKEQIDEIFEKANEPADYIIAFYEMVYPTFYDEDRSFSFPIVGKELHEYLFKKAIDFDMEYMNSGRGAEFMKGGYMLNSGPSCDYGLKDWEIMPGE